MAEGTSQRGYDPGAMDFCEVRRTTPPIPPTNELAASGVKDDGEDTQDWNLRLYKRRERLREPVKEAETLGKTTDTGGKPLRRHLPSLKPFQYRIVVKPRGGINLCEVEGEVTRSVRAACLTPLQECPLIRVHDSQNIALICTNNLDDAKELLKIGHLRIQGKDLEVSTYSAIQEEVCRGVIHGVDDGVTDAEIEHELLAPGYEILGARRLGKSSSAVIVFSGKRVPYTVRYAWLEKRCFIYRKTRAACFNCGEAGHRTDVCPKPKALPAKTADNQTPWKTIRALSRAHYARDRTRHTPVSARRNSSGQTNRGKTRTQFKIRIMVVYKNRDPSNNWRGEIRIHPWRQERVAPAVKRAKGRRHAAAHTSGRLQ
ncbi:hypothetical protein HPB48_008342 [Haemaphysalis longicornis]|uniref:CCHC-type domain-containing protein n=1 Tax=Haemaphysalis longicornis TaxID=44386 RepID=A0A9J6FXG0_HAELO|nr:hypothetical protein HPB48_008342 [Haemaphysalis longicornis]